MDETPFSFSKFPKDFQKETMKEIAGVIKTGGSLQLVGPSGSGCSMIAKAMAQMPELTSQYYDKKYAFVLLNGTMLLKRNTVNLLRLLLSSLTMSYDITNDELHLQKEIEDKLGEICKKGNLVLIIDHVDELDFPQLQPFFTNLYFVYRKLEPKLHVMFVTDKALTRNEDIKNFGPFGKLITQHTVKVGRFNKGNCVWFIGEETEKLGKKLHKNDTEKIIELSGGFPRTIKRLAEAIKHGYKLSDLSKNPQLYLPLSLHLEELGEDMGCREDVPICKKYFESMEKGSSEDTVSGIQLKSRLTKNEAKLLKLFVTNKEQMVDRETGIEALWGKNALDVSDHAYDQIVHRLRDKLTGSTPKVQIETVRGRGHCLKL